MGIGLSNPLHIALIVVVVLLVFGAAARKTTDVQHFGRGTLRALEVNPLWVNGDQVEALDVLVITKAREQP